MIKNYISANSRSVTDRIIEPMCFTDEYQSVSAFEVKTQLNKYFNIERMGEVHVLNTPMKHEAQREFYKPDIFEFQGKSLNKEIEFKMSIRACQVLSEDYPMSVPYFIPIQGSDDYLFKAMV